MFADPCLEIDVDKLNKEFMDASEVSLILCTSCLHICVLHVIQIRVDKRVTACSKNMGHINVSYC